MKKRPRARGIDRRELMKRLVAGAGASTAIPALGSAITVPRSAMPGMPGPQRQSLGAAEPPDPALSAPDWKPKFFDSHQNETVVVLTDLIIPETDTPGAKAALANRFIDLFLSASPPEDQKEFLEALGWLDGFCLSRHNQPFTGLRLEQQKEVLSLLTHPSQDPQVARGVKLFGVIKNAIVQAYYSSEVGTLQELKYQTNPFQPEYPGCKNPDEH